MGGEGSVPLLLLDVDGVLNAVAEAGDPEVWQDWRRGWAQADGREWPILWSPSVVARLLAWHRRGLAELRWLTTWGEWANGGLRALLGLPELPVAGAPHRAPPRRVPPGGASSHAAFAGADARSAVTGRWWKLDVVLDLLDREPGRPLLWIDDDLRYERYAGAHLARTATCRLVAPASGTGLTPALLDAAEEWLEGYSRPRAAAATPSR